MSNAPRDPTARYTTAEVAARLFLSFPATRALLKAAGIPFTNAGNCRLWDGASVDALLSRLQAKPDTSSPATSTSMAGDTAAGGQP